MPLTEPMLRLPSAWLRWELAAQANRCRQESVGKPRDQPTYQFGLKTCFSRATESASCILGWQKPESGNLNELGTVGLVGLQAFPKYALCVVRVFWSRFRGKMSLARRCVE